MTNRLAASTSPYLPQHARNPVDWSGWGGEAFAAARERDVPLPVSVGHAACHWCPVMAHESFEDPTTAAPMNEHLVDVEVDREERPDVDAVYTAATQAPDQPRRPAQDGVRHARAGDADALTVAGTTLEAMARGGLYDQLGGGFARYSVDGSWTVPHCEKTLHGNALLLRTPRSWPVSSPAVRTRHDAGGTAGTTAGTTVSTTGWLLGSGGAPPRRA